MITPPPYLDRVVDQNGQISARWRIWITGIQTLAQSFRTTWLRIGVAWNKDAARTGSCAADQTKTFVLGTPVILVGPAETVTTSVDSSSYDAGTDRTTVLFSADGPAAPTGLFDVFVGAVTSLEVSR